MDAVMEILQQIPAQGPTPTAVQVCAMQPSLHVSIKGFMGSVQDPIETSTVPTSTTHPTTMPPSAIQASNNTQSSTQLPTERTYPPGFFFQRIRCWTDEQLDALNISHNPMVSPRILIENNYIPTRRDREVYTNLLRAFTEPNELDISEYNATSTMMKHNQLQSTFHLLSLIFDMAFKNEPMPCTVDILIMQLGMRINVFKDNFLVDREPIPFHLRKFNMKGTLNCNGGIYHQTDRKRKQPLVVFAKITHPSPYTTHKREISHALLPMVTEYDHGLIRPKYTGFCISVHGTEYRITRADASHTYFEDLRHGRPTNETLLVNQTVKYDLMWREDRGEFLEAFYGMCGFLVEYWRGVGG
ncbi:hypothetical protein ASPCADRAFT_410064 [Aspergillus carbonarius ITEM 5010]|uniref:Uncharacterized protein n=1 Tax=Aspergillus carbonarius (strain ITEM 5010) TaxID=602072 RepID=A0A1R3R7T4_ASPC5|nr:hypothetical protein ASPCADRAFT_410064 [Aspergillus carbonarius ITEM 5010]